MKKISKLLLCLIALVPLISGCDKKKLADDEELYTRRGFSMVSEKGLKAQADQRFTAYYTGDNFIFTVVKENYKDLKKSKINKDSSIEDYLKIVAVKQDESYKVEKENDTYYYAFTKKVAGKDYYNFQTAVKGSDGFWFISFLCLEKNKDTYKSKFIEWSKTVEVK